MSPGTSEGPALPDWGREGRVCKTSQAWVRAHGRVQSTQEQGKLKGEPRLDLRVIFKGI